MGLAESHVARPLSCSGNDWLPLDDGTPPNILLNGQVLRPAERAGMGPFTVPAPAFLDDIPVVPYHRWQHAGQVQC